MFSAVPQSDRNSRVCVCVCVFPCLWPVFCRAPPNPQPHWLAFTFTWIASDTVSLYWLRHHWYRIHFAVVLRPESQESQCSLDASPPPPPNLNPLLRGRGQSFLAILIGCCLPGRGWGVGVATAAGVLEGVDSNLQPASFTPEPKIKLKKKKQLYIHETWRVDETQLMVALKAGTCRTVEAWKFTFSSEEYIVRLYCILGSYTWISTTSLDIASFSTVIFNSYLYGPSVTFFLVSLILFPYLALSFLTPPSLLFNRCIQKVRLLQGSQGVEKEQRCHL